MIAGAVLSVAVSIAPAASVNAPAAMPHLASPYQPYSLKLNSLFTPGTQTIGLYIKVRVDGGPALRMLLDSGAQNIVLDKHAASGRSVGTAIDLVGLGATPRAARRVAAGSLEIGDLVFHDCPMMAVDSKLLEGIDGVIPLSLFSGFLVRLDAPAKMLHLEPYPAEAPVQDAGYSPVRADRNLLFFDAVVNESHAGYVLLDTGATYNAVSPAAAQIPMVSASPVALRGGTGDIFGYMLPAGVRFRLGSRTVSADPAVVVDLSDLARHHEFEVAGVLGYPALCRSVITVNYRDAMVRLDGK